MRSAFTLSLRNGVSLAAIAASLLLASVPASAQEAMETVVVTGIRASLTSAMITKRDASQVMDAITAEDIGTFPDKDMGEALQRVTGVQINRSSGGEGATVTIRGSDPNMTRVEINGTGALSTTANGSDRAIDFRDLPVEFVQRLEVIKSPTADMIEGGIGGTVRVVTRRPFDAEGAYLAGSAQDVNSNLSRTDDPKLALIGSMKFFHDTVGVLVAGEYEQRHEYDGQALTTGWLQQDYLNTTTPPALRTVPAYTAQGYPANPCGSFFGPSAPTTCGAGYTNAAGVVVGNWYPQIPRYFNQRRNTLRKGLNTVVEFRPTDDFRAYWDVTYADAWENDRNQALQLNANGGIFDYAHTTVGPDHTVDHIELTSNGGVYPGGACTSSSRPNTNAGCLPLDLTFRNILGGLRRTQLQTAVGFSYNITDELTVDAREDFSRSKVDNEETDFVATIYGLPRAIVDYTNSQRAPDIQLPGVDFAHGTQVNNVQANYIPVTDTSREISETVNLKYHPAWASWVTLKAGVFRHDYTLAQWAWSKRITMDCTHRTGAGASLLFEYATCAPLTAILAPIGTNPIPFYSTGNLGFNDEVRTWMDPQMADVRAVEAATGVNIYDLSTYNPNPNTTGNFKTYTSNWNVKEGTTDFYGQADFDFPDFYLPVSGNVGIREVSTHTSSTGYGSVANTPASYFPGGVLPASCPAPCQTYQQGTIVGHYREALPSANLKIDIIPDELIARFAYGKVMARPVPTQIAFGGTLDIVGLTGTQGNPTLLPFLSTDYNAGLEWYFSKINFISATFFQKNISRFTQSATIPLDVNGVTYSIKTFTNSTAPITINGVEFGGQYAFDWLPEPFDGFGVTANMTIQKDHGYTQHSLIDGSLLPFQGVSRQAENASVFYEKYGISARVSYVWRAKWLINALGRGNLPEFNKSFGEIDASVSYDVTPYLTVFADGVNLTDQQLVQYNAPVRPIQFSSFGTRLFFGVRAKY
jgi:iron complex outermembrane receptor protein